MNKSIDFNQGYNDGIASANMANPIHNNWPESGHPNSKYEQGYWAGWSIASKDYGTSIELSSLSGRLFN